MTSQIQKHGYFIVSYYYLENVLCMVIVIYTFCHSIIKSFPFIARHAAAVSNAKDVYSNLLVQVLRVIRLGNARLSEGK